MRIQSYTDFSLNEGMEWKEDLDFEFPCLLTQENPEEFPCVQIANGEESDLVVLWNSKGNVFHQFPIKKSAYHILTQNPGSQQMVQIDPWSQWIRNSDNRDNVIEIREFLEELDIEEDLSSPGEELEMILDLCDLGHVTVPYIEEIGNGTFLAKLSNGMESEMQINEEGLLKVAHIYADQSSKIPLFSFDLIPHQRWTFHATENPIVISNGSLSTEKAKIIKSLIRATLSDEIDENSRQILVSYYDQLLKELTSVDRSEIARKNIDTKDEEILKFKSLVSKYIGEKTADELYRKAKQTLYHNK
jgi:hypothetical protein